MENIALTNTGLCDNEKARKACLIDVETVASKLQWQAGCKALVVDDEPISYRFLAAILESLSISVLTAPDVHAMYRLLEREHFHLIFLDYQLGNADGLELLEDIIGQYPRTKVIMITSHSSIGLAMKAMHKGASGFIAKPFDRQTVFHEVKCAVGTRRSNVSQTPAFRQNYGIVGVSPAILRIHEQIDRMKNVETTVLITGESGTGKELVARALHDRSSRCHERFEAVNCAAIPENLLEAELFGYKRGAFTDAKTDRKGLFEVCSSGTLFLDEIGELTLLLQSKLLRVLQDKTITPLGSSASAKVGTRIVAATNRNLPALVKEGRFRLDLYYRLSVLQIETPPLRDHPDDIMQLTEYFIDTLSQKMGRCTKSLSNEVMARLASYEWPGNVRELQNALERAIILSKDGTLDINDIFLERETFNAHDLWDAAGCVKELSVAKDEFEKHYLEKVLRLTKGNVARAAKIAGRIRTDMYRLFTKYDIDADLYK